MYTETSAGDIFQKRATLIAAVTSDSLVDNAPLRRLIESSVDAAMVQKIAEEYGKGRLLFVLTTNLDQSRPVIWNIGAIAATNNPKARDLIVDVLLGRLQSPRCFRQSCWMSRSTARSARKCTSTAAPLPRRFFTRRRSRSGALPSGLVSMTSRCGPASVSPM